MKQKTKKQIETLNAQAFITTINSLAAIAVKSKVKEKTKGGKVKHIIKPTLDEAKAWLMVSESLLASVIATAAKAKADAKDADEGHAFKGEVGVTCGKVKSLSVNDKKLMAIASAQMKRAVNLKSFAPLFAAHISK